MKIYFKIISLILLTSSALFVLIPFLINHPCLAQGSLEKELRNAMKETREVAGYPGGKTAEPTRLPKMIGQIISIVLSFVGVIFMILLIYGGFLWMTAGGNEEHIKKAKGILKNATIGLIIALSAYGITYFIVQRLSLAGRECVTITPEGECIEPVKEIEEEYPP